MYNNNWPSVKTIPIKWREMKKISTILDQTTIINFPFFYKLVKRYYVTSLLVPLVVLAYAIFFYSKQNTIFVQNIGFTIVRDQNSGSKSIAALMGEQVNNLTFSDMLLITRSHDYLNSIAKKIVAHKDFDKFIFDDIGTKEIKDNIKIFGFCNKNISCFEKEVKSRLEGFIKVVENPIVDNYISLEIRTLDEHTTSALLKAAQESLVEVRIEALTKVLADQERTIERLINEKNTMLTDFNLEDIEKNLNQKKSDSSLLEIKINDLEKELQRQKINLELAQSKMEQTKKVLNSDKVSTRDIDLIEKIKLLEVEVKNLKRDIQAVELSQAELGTTDNQVLSQLKKDLIRKEEELNKARSQSKVTGIDTDFINKKDVFSKDIAFEFKVATSQVTKTIQRLEALKVEKQKIQLEVTEMEKKIEDLSPVFTQLKLLKNKLSQTILLKSTITSDISFDKESSGISRFKKTTKGKVLTFTIVLMIFMMMVAIMLRYIFDSRIYDEYELQENFKDLEIIGHTPKFK